MTAIFQREASEAYTARYLRDGGWVDGRCDVYFSRSIEWEEARIADHISINAELSYAPRPWSDDAAAVAREMLRIKQTRTT